ncbi:uncharacterized protein [Fopius arisanus]|uniref:Odorant receptor n=1 Tax=Fopius arisanus TaxID=64838 RepID=A0A0C9REV4_9HYME|nr:PREDICTED: uncharacterized protein LOC105263084 [Fopius arisanus]
MIPPKVDMQKNCYPLNKSYLHFNLRCLTWFGIWNPYEREDGKKYWLYQVYWVFAVNIIMAMRVGNIFMEQVHVENSAEFLDAFSHLGVIIADVITYLAFFFHRVEVWDLAEAFNWERHLPGTHEISRYRNTVVTSSMNSSKLFAIVIFISPIQYFTLAYYSIFYEADYNIDNLPIGIAPMKYSLISKNFWFAFFWDYLSFTHLGLITVGQNAFIMAIMINIKAQLKMLNYRMERCHLTTYEMDNSGDYDDSDVIHFECIERPLTDKSVSLNPNEELINCIRLHQQILWILETFKTIYNKALLPQLGINLLIITVILLRIALGRRNNSGDAVIAIGYLLPVVLQFFTYCWGGNIILVESDKSTNSLYASHWYNCDKEFRENVKIFFDVIRNPLIIKVGGLYDLSALTFKNVITKAYSGVAVLQNMSE